MLKKITLSSTKKLIKLLSDLLYDSKLGELQYCKANEILWHLKYLETLLDEWRASHA